jgi:hypothetical protein
MEMVNSNPFHKISDTYFSLQPLVSYTDQLLNKIYSLYYPKYKLPDDVESQCETVINWACEVSKYTREVSTAVMNDILENPKNFPPSLSDFSGWMYIKNQQITNEKARERAAGEKPWQECMMTHTIKGDIMFWSEMVKMTKMHGKSFDGIKYFMDNCKFEPVRTKMFNKMAEDGAQKSI